MYDRDVQHVLRCPHCNKPFDKPATVKRHGYYCRSRKAGLVSRSKSCLSCVKAKARCDVKTPQCSRCTTKGIECHYPQDSRDSATSTKQRSDGAITDAEQVARDVEIDSLDNNFPAFDSFAPNSVEPNLAPLDPSLFDWSNTDIDLVSLDSPQTTGKALQPLPPGLPPAINSTATFSDWASQIQQSYPLTMSMQPDLSSPRWIVQRPKHKTGRQRISRLIFHCLKSYLLIMKQSNNNSFPPFLHSRSISLNNGTEYTEPLTNCLNLMGMFNSGFQGSRKMFWKNVRLECARFCEEYQRMNKWEVLVAIQALSIYLLARVDEGETEHNDFDLLLISAVTTMAKELTREDIDRNDIPCSSPSVPHDHTLEVSWKSWIFEESRRRFGFTVLSRIAMPLKLIDDRISIIYQVVDMLVYFEPAKMCDLPTDLLLAPLPAAKQLWEAGDEFAWKQARDGVAETSTAFALCTNGELIKLQESHLQYSDGAVLHKSIDPVTALRSGANWEGWCAGMDGLGGLVMLAASLIE